jgi:hypothetical protein
MDFTLIHYPALILWDSYPSDTILLVGGLDIFL